MLMSNISQMICLTLILYCASFYFGFFPSLPTIIHIMKSSRHNLKYQATSSSGSSYTKDRRETRAPCHSTFSTSSDPASDLHPSNNESSSKDTAKSKSSSKKRVFDSPNRRYWFPKKTTEMNGPGFKFTVMSYNILSDSLMAFHTELYRGCKNDDLIWINRWPRILKEIRSISPDVLALQEAQTTTHLLFNPKRSDVRLAQTALLLAELQRLSFVNLSKFSPVIIAGDFNFTPNSMEHNFWMNGKAKFKQNISFGLRSIGLTSNCVHEHVEKYQHETGSSLANKSPHFIDRSARLFNPLKVPYNPYEAPFEEINHNFSFNSIETLDQGVTLNPLCYMEKMKGS
ncbi:ANGEL [Lepeophtheirus salmonis]|uniref:ANGEL n=1 Tax=Lepeophtheirus salmonis TaxID=72036 RepID=A0A7R8H6U0_LEPSM|nr:ANGEL [Lepeophtheirus salmonis]CAF2895386.1 ANGEL [Lepeophtheirus salmonis]